jgi:phosphonate degradation associated HDIG domain protein
MADPVLHTLAALFATRGGARYGGEAVSQLEHGLQAAALAERDGAGDELVAAALLHDVGHLLHPHGDDYAEHGVDDRHEELGERYLRRHFAPGVAGPVRLHVPAKRFLCAAEPGYLATLSPASVRSLALQGGPMPPAETAAFTADPHAAAAIRLRRWDDAAKVPGLPTPPFAHFLPVLERCRVAS